MADKDTIKKTLIVATLLCIVCSVLVSASAVLLEETKKQNKTLDRNKNILLAAGLFRKGDPDSKIPEIFQEDRARRFFVETKVVDLATGDFNDQIDPVTFDQRKAARDPATSEAISPKTDIASVRRRSKSAVIYLVKEGGEISQIVLPVHGMGLWSTMYGFLALDKNTTTVRGFTFYEHGETPGLGGEVENPVWQAKWVGKEIFDSSWNIDIEVVKGTANREAKHQVDGLAGATITSRGVTHLLHYWLGDEAFGPLLRKLRAEP